MKSLIKIGLTLLLALPALLKAEEKFSPITVSVTNTIPASTTESVNVGQVIDIRYWEGVSLQYDGALAGAGTSATTITLLRSNNGITWETTPAMTWAFPMTGATAVCLVTNIPRDTIRGVGFIKVKSIQNGNTQAITGQALIAGRKRTE